MSAATSTLPDWDTFPVYWLAKRYRTSAHHVADLVDEGQFGDAMDLRGKAASRSLIRIPRAAVIEFEARRKISPNGNGNHKERR